MEKNKESKGKKMSFLRPTRNSKLTNIIPVKQIQQGQFNQQGQNKRGQTKHVTAFGFQIASYGLALERQKTSSNRYHKGEEISFFVDRQHFKIYGPGIYLFFQFLWKLSLLFLVLSIISCIPIVFNYIQGGRFQNAKQNLSTYIGQVSISNFQADDITISQDQRLKISAKAKLINCITDLVCSFLVMAFYFYWTNQSTKKTEQIKKTVKLANYFTLQLTQFPQNATQQKVYQLFSYFGNVTQVAPVKNYSQTIDLSKKIYQHQVQIKQLKIQQQRQKSTENEEKIKQIQKNIQKLYQKLAKQYQQMKGDIIKYYVTFSTTQEKTQTFKKFNKIYGVCCLCCSNIPNQYLLDGQKIKVQNCHEQPGQILWQNVHITWKTRWIRAVIQFLLLLIFVGVGFFIISTLNIITPPSQTDSIDTSMYDQTSIFGQTSDPHVVQSWCLKNNQKASSTSALKKLCDVYIERYYFNTVITYSITLIIVIVKVLLKNLVIFIAKFQRYKQHTQQSVDIVKNLVIIYILTTIVIGFLLQANLFGIRFKTLIFSIIHNKLLQQNASLLDDYSELTNKWYLDIGYKIWFTWLILAFSPHFYMPIYHYIMECLRESFAKGSVLQKDMEKALEAEEFPIEDNYANIIMIFLVSLTFSGGMPIMLIISFIAIITRYAYYKFHFIRFCKVPNTFDQVLNETVLSYFPWALGFHFAISIWMYSVPTIFITQKSFLSDMLLNSSSSTLVFLKGIFERLAASYYYAIGAAAIMLIILMKEIIYDFFAAICKTEDDQILQQINMSDTSKKFNNVVRSQRAITTSYRIQNNPNYFQILSIKQKMINRCENLEKDNILAD